MLLIVMIDEGFLIEGNWIHICVYMHTHAHTYAHINTEYI